MQGNNNISVLTSIILLLLIYTSNIMATILNKIKKNFTLIYKFNNNKKGNGTMEIKKKNLYWHLKKL